MPYSSWAIDHLNPPWKQIQFREIRAEMAAAAAAEAAAAAAARPGPAAPPNSEEEEPAHETEANPVPDPAPASNSNPTPEEPASELSEERDDIPPPDIYCPRTDKSQWSPNLIYEPTTCEDFLYHNLPHVITIMAKTAKLKRLAQSKSPHSRAAKRASSPSINLDKSLKNIVAPATNKPTHPSVLAVHHGAGITKRKVGKPLKRQQRRRQEKGMERAEAVMDKVATKMEKGKAKERVVKERSAAWDEHNRKLPLRKREMAPKAEAGENAMETEEEVDEAEWAKEEPGAAGVEEDLEEVL